MSEVVLSSLGSGSTPSDETIVLDPTEFISNRVELELDQLGIAIRTAEWGDSAHELFLIRRALGEIPADSHPPNRTATLTLRVMEESNVSLATAAHKLQAKVGLIQREQGAVRRQFDDAGLFAASVCHFVYGADLGGLHGWMMAHRSAAPDVTLVLHISPYCYGSEEQELSDHVSTNSRRQTFTEENVTGTAPGIIRVTVDNDGADDWLSLIASIESRDYSADATAAPFYECEALTNLGDAADAVRAGASGGDVVSKTLPTAWVPILDSEIAGVGHMTHKGPRRMFVRVYDPNGTAEQVDLRLEWSVGPYMNPELGPIRRIHINNDFSLIDLAPVMLDEAPLGDHRWEWRILGKGVTAGNEIELDCVMPLSAEQLQKIVATEIAPTSGMLEGPSSSDTQISQDPFPAASGQTWDNPTFTAASDDTYAETPVFNTVSHELRVTDFDFAIPAGATIRGVVVEIEREGEMFNGYNEIMDFKVRLVSSGIPSVSSNRAKSDLWPDADVYAGYGAADDLWGNLWNVALINSAAFGVAIQVAGRGNAKIDHVQITVFYSEADTDQDAACFATQSVELRSDGVWRQDRTDDVWGRLAPVGRLLTAPPSVLEARPMRVVLIPSLGVPDPDDRAIVADSDDHDISARVHYFPGYHFAAEALAL